MRAFKWTYILKLNDRLSWEQGFHTVMVANLFSFLLPIRFGEILKLFIIKKIGDVSYSSSVSATLNDRFSHLLVISIFLFFTPISDFKLTNYSSAFLLFFIPFLILIVGIYFFGKKIWKILEKWLYKIIFFYDGKKRKNGDSSKDKIVIFFKDILLKTNIDAFTKANLFFIVVISALVVSTDGLCFYFIIKAFSLHLTLLQSIVAACFLTLLFILPTPPGQLGTAEVYPLMIFSWGFQMDSTVISSIAILWHLLTSAVVITLGIYSTVSIGVRIGDLWRKYREKKFEIE
jgi:uncharacterized protein (TIRG00374 family)